MNYCYVSIGVKYKTIILYENAVFFTELIQLLRKENLNGPVEDKNQASCPLTYHINKNKRYTSLFKKRGLLWFVDGFVNKTS